MSSCPGGEGKWQRTCSGCHIVCSGSLCSRVCSSPGQGRGLSSSMITGTWFSMSLTVLSFDTYVNLIRQVYELGARVVLCSRCGFPATLNSFVNICCFLGACAPNLTSGAPLNFDSIRIHSSVTRGLWVYCVPSGSSDFRIFPFASSMKMSLWHIHLVVSPSCQLRCLYKGKRGIRKSSTICSGQR